MYWVESRIILRDGSVEEEYRSSGVDVDHARSSWVEYRDRVVRFLEDIVVEVYKPEKEPLIKVYNELLDVLPKLGRTLYRVLQTYRSVTRSLRPDLVLYYSVDGSVETSYGGFFEWFHGQDLVNTLLRENGLEFVRDHNGITRIKVVVERPYSTSSLEKALHLVEVMFKLYESIKVVQEAEAVKTTLNFLNTIVKLLEPTH